MKVFIAFIGVLLSSFNSFSEPLKIQYSEFKPMVWEENGKVQGFDIDLVNKIFEGSDYQLSFENTDNKSRFDGIQNGTSDILIGGVSITSDRESVMDFTAPYITSSLMVASKKSELNTFFAKYCDFILIVLKRVIALFIFIIIFSILFWLLERNDDKEGINDKFFPGVPDAIWYSWVTMTTVGYGDFVVKTWLGKVMAMILMLVGIGFAGSIISELSALKINENNTGAFKSLQELEHKNIAIVSNTISENIQPLVSANFIKFKSYPEMEYVFKNTNDLDCMIFDAPAIMYTVKKDESLETDIEFKIFKNDLYALCIKTGNKTLQEFLNYRLLKLKESGEIDSLMYKWFN